MSTPRFFVPPQNIKDKQVIVTGLDVRHIRDVLRLKRGDRIEVLDGQGSLYEVAITTVASQYVDGQVVRKKTQKSLLPLVTLLQALPKFSKMDLIVRQATELGVSRIVPLVTERTVVKLDSRRSEQRASRWQKISREAAKQSQRLTIPEVAAPISWSEAVKLFPYFDKVIVFWEEERRRLVDEVVGDECSSIGVIIGPEGGLSPSEIRLAVENKAITVTLGRQILRAETASVAALAVLYHYLNKRFLMGD